MCAFEVEVPDIRLRLGAQIVDVAGLSAQIEADSRAKSQSLQSSATSASRIVVAKCVRVLLADLGASAARMARHNNVSVVALDTSSSDKKALAQSLIFEMGRPVILAPEAGGADWDIGTVAIAWDGGRSASRAVHDAMPLIMEANGTVLVTAFDDKHIGEVAVAEPIAYLERHTVTVSHHDANSAGKTLGSTLQVAAREQGAGLLVMGAFGHSRLRDIILGGATQNILQDLKMPVFLSH